MTPSAPRFSPFLLLLAACVALGGCQASGDRGNEMPQRVTPSAASLRIGQALPDARSSSDRPPAIEETTPEGLFTTLATQTFRIIEGVRENDTWAVTATLAVPLGTGYGGPGIIAWHLGDLDADGNPELAYAYGSGSGVTRFEVGLYDRPGDPLRGQPRTRRVPLSYRNPLAFRESAQGLEVWDASRNEKVGLITAYGETLRFTPAAPLPQGVLDRLLEPRVR